MFLSFRCSAALSPLTLHSHALTQHSSVAARLRSATLPSRRGVAHLPASTRLSPSSTSLAFAPICSSARRLTSVQSGLFPALALRSQRHFATETPPPTSPAAASPPPRLMTPRLQESIEKERAADAAWHERKWEKADALFAEALALREQEFGRDSLELATLVSSIAVFHQLIGDAKRAATGFRRYVDLLRARFGERNFAVGAALNDLGRALEDSGDKQGAEKCYTDAFAAIGMPLPLPPFDSTRTHYPALKSTSATKSSPAKHLPATNSTPLASAETDAEDGGGADDESDLFASTPPEEASVSEIRASLFVSFAANLAMLHENAGDWASADRLHIAALTTVPLQRLQRWDHPHLVSGLADLDSEALASDTEFPAIVEEQTRRLGAHNPALLQSLYYMYYVHSAKREKQQAVAVAKARVERCKFVARIVAIQSIIRGPESLPAATAYTALAIALREVGDLRESERLLRKALYVKSSRITPHHVHAAFVALELGITLLLADNADDGVAYIQLARYEIARELGSTHPYVEAIERMRERLQDELGVVETAPPPDPPTERK